jgi:glyoxylase-like metal-dependent hydrolase (beta-lactamase superfamily II)
MMEADKPPDDEDRRSGCVAGVSPENEEEEAVKMKIVVVAMVLAAFVATGESAIAGLTRIAGNVYSYAGVKNAGAGNSFAANAGIVVGRDGVLVVDTMISAKEARRFIGDIRKVASGPLRFVVNTHYHLDHAFGNGEFAGKGGIVIAHAADRDNLERKGSVTLKHAKDYGLSEEDMVGTEIALPVLTFTDRMSIDLGDEKVELIHVAPSHTAGSILVLVPGRKVLFTGDVLFSDFHPYLAEGDLAGWIKTLDFILSLDVDTIIPGHGPVSSKKEVEQMKQYLLAFDRKARELAAKSGDADYIASELQKALPHRSQGEFLIPANVRQRYLSDQGEKRQ